MPVVSSTPSFTTLLWDSIKTTAYFGGKIPGTIMGVSGALLAACVGAPEFGFGVGFAVGASVFSAVGAHFSIPFALVAEKTRKFRNNDEIEAKINLILKITNEGDKNRVINDILKITRNFDFGIQSYESYNLISILEDKNSFFPFSDDKPKSVDEKWEALKSYLQEKSDNCYVHNGKKTFNAIIDVIPNMLKTSIKENKINTVTKLINNFPNIAYQVDEEGKNPIDWAYENNRPIIKELLVNNGAIDQTQKRKDELKQIIQIIKHPAWQQEGFSILKNYIPSSIVALRKYLFEQQNLDVVKIEEMDPADILKICSTLKRMGEGFGFSITRGTNIKTLHQLIGNIGNNPEGPFDKLKAFNIPELDHHLCSEAFSNSPYKN